MNVVSDTFFSFGFYRIIISLSIVMFEILLFLSFGFTLDDKSLF